MHRIVRNFQDGDSWILSQIDLQGYEEPLTEDQIRHVRKQISVLTLNGEVIGFFAVESEKNHAKVQRFAIATAHRRKGHGEFLLQSLEAEYAYFRRITTIVAEANFAAQLFLRKGKWKCQSIIKNAFLNCGTPEAGLFFVRILNSSPRQTPS